jgi:4-amino-4-deoxy-L-arabinose transferase-like glycosyltransferase
VYKLLNTDTRAYLFIALAASLLFIPFIGNMHLFDWDEINFAECSREMLVSGNYSDVQLYFRPFWEKPPLFIWLQSLSMYLFGINEFGARFPNAFCGIITLLTIYNFGKKLNDYRFGLTWAFVYASTLLPHLFFKSGIIDPWFNFFIFCSVYQLIQHTNNPVGKFGFKTALFSGFFLGLALLTKGPAALLLVGLMVVSFFVWGRFKKISSIKFITIFFITFLLTGFSWFIIEIIKGNSHIIIDFVEYQIRLFKTEDSGHGQPFIYHFIILLLGCFPSSLFLILAHKPSNTDTPYQKHVKRWMFCLFWVVLLVFSIVKTKIVHYSSLCYFPLTYLATYAIFKLQAHLYDWKKWFHRLCVAVTSLLGITFILVGCLPFLKSWLIHSNLIDDAFAVENLKANVHWLGIEWLIGVLFLSFTLFLLYKIYKQKLKYVFYIFVVSLLTTMSLLITIAPKIEQYSQKAAIDFYEFCGANRFYVETIGFKSYGSLFYGRYNKHVNYNYDFQKYRKQNSESLAQINMNPTINQNLIFKNWLAEGMIDRPACFVAKCTDYDVTTVYKELKVIYRKNGFVFLIRLPKK